MSYNKTTWQTGDKITAAKMNKIEDGIAAAEQSGGSIAGLLIMPDGWGNGTHILGSIAYFEQKNGVWQMVSEGLEVYWPSNQIASYHMICPPSDSGIKVFWAIYRPRLADVDLIFSGDISTTQIDVYDFNNVQLAGYELSGIGYVNALAQ